MLIDGGLDNSSLMRPQIDYGTKLFHGNNIHSKNSSAVNDGVQDDDIIMKSVESSAPTKHTSNTLAGIHSGSRHNSESIEMVDTDEAVAADKHDADRLWKEELERIRREIKESEMKKRLERKTLTHDLNAGASTRKIRALENYQEMNASKADKSVVKKSMPIKEIMKRNPNLISHKNSLLVHPENTPHHSKKTNSMRLKSIMTTPPPKEITASTTESMKNKNMIEHARESEALNTDLNKKTVGAFTKDVIGCDSEQVSLKRGSRKNYKSVNTKRMIEHSNTRSDERKACSSNSNSSIMNACGRMPDFRGKRRSSLITDSDEYNPPSKKPKHIEGTKNSFINPKNPKFRKLSCRPKQSSKVISYKILPKERSLKRRHSRLNDDSARCGEPKSRRKKFNDFAL